MDGNIIQVFSNDEFGEIRVSKDENGEPWFVISDLCKALDLSNPSMVASRLSEDDLSAAEVIDSLGRKQMANITNEGGMYEIVFMSRKPEAKRFKRWVTHEVLPAIRRDGAYVASDGTEDDSVLMARALIAADRAIRRKDARIAALEPKAGFFDACMDGERWMSFTEAARLLHQHDKSMIRKRLFRLAMDDGIITRDKQASKLGIDRGYVANYQPPAYFDQTTGEMVRPRPYAKVTSKGLSWMLSRYCPQKQLEVS